MTYAIDPEAVRQTWATVLRPGQVTELRCLNCVLHGERRPGTYSGYFTAEAVDAVLSALSAIQSADGCYFIPNPLNPALLARSPNRARMVWGKQPTTADHDIERRHWVLIDVDPVKPAGISSTDAEKDHAERLIVDIDHDFAFNRGFGPGIIADSGNGCHLLLPVDWPADDNGRCERLLKYLDREFSTPVAKVDISVHNPARIWRLYGTPACKGSDCPELGRPWRTSRITTVCMEHV